VEYQTAAMTMTQDNGNSTHVRHVFENTTRYLKSRNVDIRVRIDTASSFASSLKRERVLDIGCGDGSISLQLLTPGSFFTLMDISSSMIATAKNNIPNKFVTNVETRNENFASASFDGTRFDLVVAVGVMAHVDSPDTFLGKIREVLQPGGSLILEFTDAYHFIGTIGRWWSWMKELVRPARYPTNKLSFADVKKLLKHHHLKTKAVFRYSRMPIPGFNIIVNHAREFKLVQTLFGRAMNNRNAWMGNEYIILLEKE
jgi:ubiquinone/menaquinone biosynthesis C-methylase UbiE